MRTFTREKFKKSSALENVNVHLFVYFCIEAIFLFNPSFQGVIQVIIQMKQIPKVETDIYIQLKRRVSQDILLTANS